MRRGCENRRRKAERELRLSTVLSLFHTLLDEILVIRYLPFWLYDNPDPPGTINLFLEKRLANLSNDFLQEFIAII